MLTRRIFLRGSAIAMAGMGEAPMWLARAAATESRKRKTLVAIFMRGAADGLNIVVPFGDPKYRELRPTLALQAPRPGDDENNNGPFGSVIDLDGMFGLNAGLRPLKALWDSKQLAIVEATGSPDPSRSHFDAQDYMESGTPGKTGSGWLSRALGDPGADSSPLRAVALSNRVPRTLRGDHEAVALGNVQDFNISDQDRLAILKNMYSLTADAQLRRTGKDAFDAMKMIQSLDKEPTNNADRFAPRNGRPDFNQGGQLGINLRQLARLIKSDAGVEAAFADIDGWDHHQNENGQLPNLLNQLSNAIASLCQDLGDRMEDVVIVTMSEFGRTAEENGNGGTDHGHGSMMMVMGGPVSGGKIYGEWPGLAKEQLFEGRDLAVTTDFRTVLSELVRGHLGTEGFGFGFSRISAGRRIRAVAVLVSSRLKIVARALVRAVSILISTPVPPEKRSVERVSTRHAESVRHKCTEYPNEGRILNFPRNPPIYRLWIAASYDRPFSVNSGFGRNYSRGALFRARA